MNPGHQRPRHRFFQECNQQLCKPSRDIICHISVGSEEIVHDVVMERRGMGSKAGDDFVVQRDAHRGSNLVIVAASEERESPMGV